MNADKYAKLKAIAAGEIKDTTTMSSDIRFWTHEPHQPLIGEIVGFDSFEHPRYGTQKTVIVQRETGETVSAILTKYLENGMQLKNGQIGDLVLIEKQGQKLSQHGNTYNDFQFVLEKVNQSSTDELDFSN
jgi:hypothetical protein